MASPPKNELRPPPKFEASPDPPEGDAYRIPQTSQSDDTEISSPRTPILHKRFTTQESSNFHRVHLHQTREPAKLDSPIGAQTGNSTDALLPPLFQLAISDTDASPPFNQRQLMTPVRTASPHFTQYDPGAKFDSPDARRPASAPAWVAASSMDPQIEPFLPSALLDVNLELHDWQILDQFVRAFDREELRTFNSVVYSQVLNQLGLDAKPQWEKVLIHLGLQNEQLWIDRLHNFQEDYVAQAEKSYAKRQMALRGASMVKRLQKVWFDRWHSAAVLHATYLRYNRALVAANFRSWRQFAAYLNSKATEVSLGSQRHNKKALVSYWRERARKIAGLSSWADSYHDERLVTSMFQRMKNTVRALAEAETAFTLRQQSILMATLLRRTRERVAEATFLGLRRQIYVGAWSVKLVQRREQYDKSVLWDRQSTLPGYLSRWRAQLAVRTAANATANEIASHSTQCRVLCEWRRACRQRQKEFQIRRQAAARIQKCMLSHWRYLAFMKLEAERFHGFFVKQRALNLWRVSTRSLQLQCEHRTRLAAKALAQLRLRHRQELLSAQAQRKTAVRVFESWRGRAQRESRREHALSIRALALEKRLQFAKFCFLANKISMRRQKVDSAARGFYEQRLLHERFSSWRKASAAQCQAALAAEKFAAHNMQQKFLATWKTSFDQVRDAQFAEVDLYAIQWHAKHARSHGFEIWRHRATERAEAEWVARTMDTNRFFRRWLTRYIDLEETRAEAGAYFISRARSQTFGLWRRRLAQVRQADVELELFVNGREMEKTVALLERWRTAATLARDKDALLERRLEWMAQRQRRAKFRRWRQKSEKTTAPQTPLRSEAVLQRSTVRRWLSRREPPVFRLRERRVDGRGSPVLRPGAETLI